MYSPKNIRKRLSFAAALAEAQIQDEEESAADKGRQKKTPFQKELSAIDPRVLALARLTETGPWEARGKIPLAPQMERLKSQFKQLKFQYLELETKRAFLTDLCDEKVLSQEMDSKIAALEGDVAASKASVRSVKASTQEAGTDLLKWTDELLRNYEKLIEQRNDVVKLIDRYVTESDGGDSQPMKKHKDGNSGDTDDTDDPAHEIIADLVHVKDLLNNLDDETLKLQEKVKTAKNLVSNEVNRREKAYADAKSAIPDSVWEMAAWYKDAVAVLEKLGGVSIVEYTEMGVVFRMQLKDSNSFRIKLLFGDDDGLCDATVTPCPPTLSLDDIVAYAVQKNDVAFLFREVEARLTNHLEADAEIQRMRDDGHFISNDEDTLRFSDDIKTSDGKVAIKVSVSPTAKLYYLELLLYVPLDYPLPHAPARLISVSDAVTGTDGSALDATVTQAGGVWRGKARSDDEIDAIKAEIEEQKLHRMEQIVSYFKGKV